MIIQRPLQSEKHLIVDAVLLSGDDSDIDPKAINNKDSQQSVEGWKKWTLLGIQWEADFNRKDCSTPTWETHWYPLCNIYSKAWA